MTFALTSARFYGIEHDEAITSKFLQVCHIKATAANTDVDFDLGDTTPGTFWNAVDASAIGLEAFNAFKDMITNMESFVSLTGKGIAQYAQADASIPQVLAIDSAATAGGNATEACTFTGLATVAAGDTVLGLTQMTDGDGAAVGILAFGTQITNGLSITWNADPGAGAVVRASVLRAAVTTVQAGTYQLSLDATTGIPNILYLSGDAPTVYDIFLVVDLKDGANPINDYIV